MRISLLMLGLSLVASDVLGQTGDTKTRPTERLQIVEDDRALAIDVRVAVDGESFDAYWSRTFQALFEFADVNGDGQLADDELRYLPAARSVRLSLGTGYAPPISALRSLAEITGGESRPCSRKDVESYYRRHGIGRLTIGCGKLPHTSNLTQAMIEAFDQNRDGAVTASEWSQAEVVLRKLDANDDELLAAEELLPNRLYPGIAATTNLPPEGRLDFSRDGVGKLQLVRRTDGDATRGDKSQGSSNESTVEWKIGLGDDMTLSAPTPQIRTRFETWTVPGPLAALHDSLRETLAEADPTAPPDPEPGAGNRNRGRRPSRAWLTPLVDRDRDDVASPDEIEKWLEVQRRLARGQCLLSVYGGGGLFEWLDANHDAALSLRELRNAWGVMTEAAIISENRIDPSRVPNVVLVIVSNGYPASLKRPGPMTAEWFQQMDRNSDGDVSRREFTGALTAFARLDQDKDGLISPQEATAAAEK